MSIELHAVIVAQSAAELLFKQRAALMHATIAAFRETTGLWACLTVEDRKHATERALRQLFRQAVDLGARQVALEDHMRHACAQRNLKPPHWIG
jgi:hypothetical protein